MANGLVVYLASGYNSVSFSGSIAANVSGQFVTISGLISITDPTAGGVTAAIISNDQFRSPLTIGLATGAFTYGYDAAANVWERLRITTSGDGLRLKVSTSGQPTAEYGTTLSTQGGTVISSLSGGTQLANIPGFSVQLRNISGNAVMMVGSTTTPPNFIGVSGIGYPLYGGEQMPMPIKVDNANKIRVLAGISGQSIAVFVTNF